MTGNVTWNTIVSDEAAERNARTLESAEEMVDQGCTARQIAQALPCSIETARDIIYLLRSRRDTARRKATVR